MDAFAVLGDLHAAIYGRVVLAQHRESGRVVAIKLMSRPHMAVHRSVAGPRVHEDGNTELRVLRRLTAAVYSQAYEDPDTQDDNDDDDNTPPRAEAAVRLREPPSDHHNLLLLLGDFVEWRTDSRGLVFDHCPHGELFDRVASGALAPQDAKRYFRQVATALAFVHAQDVAHRDVSLENVLLDAEGDCRLADFGLATLHGSSCTGRVGKAFYMAPEVFASSPTPFGTSDEPGDAYNGLRADVWSLGVLLFILATGVPPFETPSERDPRFRTVQAHGVRELLKRWQFDRGMAPELCDLLVSMLRIDPSERPTVAEVCAHSWLVEDDGGEPRAANPEPQRELDADEDVCKSPDARQRKRIKVVVDSEDKEAKPRVRGMSLVAANEASDRWNSPVPARRASAAAMVPAHPRASPAVWPSRVKTAAAPRCRLFDGENSPSDQSTLLGANLQSSSWPTGESTE